MENLKKASNLEFVEELKGQFSLRRCFNSGVRVIELQVVVNSEKIDVVECPLATKAVVYKLYKGCCWYYLAS